MMQMLIFRQGSTVCCSTETTQWEDHVCTGLQRKVCLAFEWILVESEVMACAFMFLLCTYHVELVSS